MIVSAMPLPLGRLVLVAAAGLVLPLHPVAADPRDAAAELQSGPAATVAIGSDDCRPQWNGAPVTPDQLLERSVDLLEQAIDRIGGPQNATEENIPYVSVETASGTTWRCMAPTLFNLQRSGMIKLRLRDAFVYFAMNVHQAAEQPAERIDVGPNGRVAWNGDAADLNGLSAHVRALGDEASVPDRMFLDVAPDATFLELNRAAQAIEVEGGCVTLTGCGGPMGPYRPGVPECPSEPQ